MQEEKFKKYTYPNLILKIKFKDHKKYKTKLLNLLKKSGEINFVSQDNYYNDKLLRTDWLEASNWRRPWVKLIFKSIYSHLKECAEEMGYQSIKLHKLWYQQYAFGDLHNWHTHDGNYTGTYYLEFDKKSSTTEFLYPNNLKKAFTIEVKEGDILFFPCHLIHRSATSQSKKTKSIISWNTDFDKVQKQYLHTRKNCKTLKEKNVI